MKCIKCGCENVTVEVVQEERGSKTVSKTKSKYKEKKHGFLWWLFIGWWWWVVDLFMWIFAFIPRLILRLFAAPWKKKKMSKTEKTISKTTNRIEYKKICVCPDCGYSWTETVK